MYDSRLLLLLLAISGLDWLPAVQGEDWPQWRGPSRSGHVALSARTPDKLPVDPKVIWRIDAGEGFASPVIAAGRLFQFDNQSGKETLRALRALDGVELWRATIDETFQDEQGPPGPRCTPVVEGDCVYAQSGKGELQCLSVADGQRRWRINFMKDFGAAFLGEDSKVPGAAEHGYTGAPVLVRERLIACVGGTNGAGVVCFDKNNGKPLWKSQNDLAAYASPVIATIGLQEQVVCFTVDGLIGLAVENGHLLWRVPLTAPYGRNCMTPIVVDDWVIGGSFRAGLVGIKVSEISPVFQAAQIWVNKAASPNFSTPVAVQGYLYGLGPAKNIICVDQKTGKLMWSKDGYISTSADAAHASFLVMGGKILVATDGGEILLIHADPAGFRELGRVQVCGRNWCDPAYADGRLYIRDGITAKGHLYCVELAPN